MKNDIKPQNFDTRLKEYLNHIGKELEEKIYEYTEILSEDVICLDGWYSIEDLKFIIQKFQEIENYKNELLKEMENKKPYDKTS